MGTRSTYRIIEKSEDQETPICLIYMQYDGYPTGHPMEVAKWLSKARVVNGFNSQDKDELVFNGAGCLAARLISFLKKDQIGNCYMECLDSRGSCGEDYMYDIVVSRTVESDYSSKYQLNMIMSDSDGVETFSGTVSDFVENYSKATV
jgi:hypothetical protein